MKTALISLLTAALLGLASSASGRLFDAADFIAIAFATGLVAWTVAQYNAVPHTLRKARPIHLLVKTGDLARTLHTGQRAA